MPETQTKPEILPHKKTLKLTPAIGDWTTYKPPKVYAKRIKSGLYGFDRLSEERLNKALLIHYNFTRDFLNLLHINLMLGSDFYSVSAEQTNYLNFLRVANYPLVDFKIQLPNWHGAISVCLDLALANSIINQSLGCRDLSSHARKLTAVEESILEIAIKEYFVPMLTNAFKNVLGGTVLSSLNSPDVITDSSVNPSSSFVHFNIEFSLADNPPGKIQVGYAGNLLKALLKKLEEQPDNKPLSLSKLPPVLLNSISVPVEVTLGTTEIGTSDLHGMEEGDVVNLESSLESPASINIGKKIQIWGQPGKTDLPAGRHGKKYAARIISLQKEEKIKVEAVTTLEEKQEEPAEMRAEDLEEEPKEEYSKEQPETPYAQQAEEEEIEVDEEEFGQETEAEELGEEFQYETEEEVEEENLEEGEENSSKGW
jgi:flagellar motor switch protein FliM